MVVDVGRQQRFVRIIAGLLPAGGPRPTGRELAAGYLVLVEEMSYLAMGAHLSCAEKTAHQHVRHLAERLDLSGVRELRAAVTRALWDCVA